MKMGLPLLRLSLKKSADNFSRPMTSFLYALNIGTLAMCMTVTGAGTVACLVGQQEPAVAQVQEVTNLDAGTFVDLDRTEAGAVGGGDAAASQAEPQVETLEIAQQALPDMPDVAEIDALPTVPEFVQPKAEKPVAVKKPAAVKAEVAKSSTPRPTSGKPVSRGGTAAVAGKSGGSGTGSGGGHGSGEGKSVGNGKGRGAVGASRFAGGSTPQPSYPASCRQRGETGRVTVNFTINEQGNVVDARVISPSKYIELNEAALRAVRRWKFSSGPRASANKTISFVL